MAGTPVSLIRTVGPKLSASADGRSITLDNGDDLALAIAALNPSASSPAVIIMPSGTYTHTSAAIAVPGGLTIKGSGGNVNVTAAFTVTGQTGVVFEGFTLSPATVAGTKLPAINFVSGTSTVTIRDMTITGGTMPAATSVIKHTGGALTLTFEGTNLVTGVPNGNTAIVSLSGTTAGTYNQSGTLTVGTYNTNKENYTVDFGPAAGINFTGELVTYGPISFKGASADNTQASFNSVQIHLAGAGAAYAPILLVTPVAGLVLHFGTINTTRTAATATACVICGAVDYGALADGDPVALGDIDGGGTSSVVSAGVIVARPVSGAAPYTLSPAGATAGSTNLTTASGCNVPALTPVA